MAIIKVYLSFKCHRNLNHIKFKMNNNVHISSFFETLDSLWSEGVLSNYKLRNVILGLLIQNTNSKDSFRPYSLHGQYNSSDYGYSDTILTRLDHKN